MTALTDVTQAYLASSFADQAIKPPVRLAATVNVTPIGIGQTIDGAVTQLGDRVLLTAQTDARQNGVRVVSDGIWSVPADFSNLVSGTLFTATAGVANAGQYSLTTANPITLGVTALTFMTSTVGGLAAETAARISADNTLQGNINAEASTRATNDTALQANINSEAATRAAADTTLQTNITAEANTRAAADTTITTNLAASTGSTLVGFTQSGTGAVQETIDAVLKERIDLTNFAVGNGSDETTQIQKCIDFAKASGRAIRVKGGLVFGYTALNLDGITSGLTIEGETDPSGAAISACSVLRCLSTGSGIGISIKSSYGVSFEKIALSYSSASYTGILVATGHSALATDSSFITFDRCVFTGEGSAINAAALFQTDLSIIERLHKCTFKLANVGIKNGTQYTNVMTVEDCTFQALNTHNVLWDGTSTCQGIYFKGNTFEALVNGKASGMELTNLTAFIDGLTFIGNWFGDVSVAGGISWIHAKALGASFAGNYFATAGGGAGDYAIQLDGCQGVSICGGNRFDDKAVNIATSSSGVVISGNDIVVGATGIAFTGAQPTVIANNGFTDTYGGLVTIGGRSTPQLLFNPSSGATKQAQIQQSANVLNINDNGIANRMSLDLATGNTTISGTFVKADARLDQTTVAYTNNAAAQTATMTNGPTAGNPTKWIPINDNGTIRNIPAW